MTTKDKLTIVKILFAPFILNKVTGERIDNETLDGFSRAFETAYRYLDMKYILTPDDMIYINKTCKKLILAFENQIEPLTPKNIYNSISVEGGSIVDVKNWIDAYHKLKTEYIINRLKTIVRS